MKFKIFAVLFLIALGVLAYFAYPVVKERYFESGNAVKNDSQKTEELTTSSAINNNLNVENDTAVDNELVESETPPANTSEEAKTEIDETGTSANITAEDCDNECANFKDNASDLKYCQNICDISPTKDSDNCESKKGTDRDYCFRNQAVAKTDLNICNSITDTKIKSSCKNRITEDMLENQL